MTDLVVAKFGGTSVADFDAMNRSIDVALLDANTRIVVLSASAGVTNILVALAGGLEPTERFSQLDALRQIQFNILERLRYPNVIREEIERLLENITTLAEAAALASSTALTDELVSHGELMSTLLFVEILRERGIQAQWFDARKVLRTNDRFGRAEPDIAAVAELTQQQLAPRLAEGLVVTQGFIGSEAKGRTTTLGRGGSDYTAALLGEALNATRVDIWTDVPGIYTTDPRVAPAAKRIDVIAFEEAAEMATFGAKVLLMMASTFFFGLVALGLIYALAALQGRDSTLGLILSGIILSGFFAALVSLMQYLADSEETLPNIVFWLLGSFATASWHKVLLMSLPLAVAAGALWKLRWRINLLALEERDARSLGVPVAALRRGVLVCCAVLVAAQVAVSGSIAWMGLVVPHLARLLVGADHRRLLPTAFWLGAALMLVVDDLARTLTQAEIPIGIITALLGAPLFTVLLVQSRRRSTTR